MITIHKNSDTGLVQIPEPTPGCWINVIDPTPEEISHLQDLCVPTDYITYPLDLDERARTERENGELLIVLRIPYFQGATEDIPYTTIPLGIILTDKFIFTICKKDNDYMQELRNGRVKNLVTAKRLRFVLQLLLSAASLYLYNLREINRSVDKLEDELQQSTRNKEVLELLKYQKSLTFFATALKSNELVLERLQRMQLFKTYPEDEDLLEDVLIENQQAIEMTNIASNILTNLMDAFASVIANNLNSVMKILASVTIVISLPTIVTSFFGMNVKLPFDQYSVAYLMIIGIALVITIVTTFFFWKRDWL